MPPKRQWEIPITPVDHPRNFEGHKAVVEQVMADMSDRQRDILANGAFTKIEITGKPVDGGIGRWNSGDRTISLSTAEFNPETPFPIVLKPLFGDFRYVATHELHHPVFYHAGHSTAYRNPLFMDARSRAVERLRADPECARKTDEMLTGMRQFLEHGMPDSFVNIDFGWRKLDPDNKEQLAVLMGILLSDEYHRVFRYTADPMKGRMKDKRYDEMLCNITALAATYGEGKVREFAPELLDYARDLTEKRSTAEEGPPPGSSAMERLRWNRRRAAADDHTGHGGGGIGMG